MTYDAGRLYAAADAGMSYVAASAFGDSITLKSGIVDGLNADSFALYAQGDVTGAADVASTVTVDGGYVLAQEFALSAQGCGAAIRFNGGAAEARDNAVIPVATVLMQRAIGAAARTSASRAARSSHTLRQAAMPPAACIIPRRERSPSRAAPSILKTAAAC